MITLYDHIQQLRAELAGCLDNEERAAIRAELEEAQTQQRVQEQQLECAFVETREPPP